MAPTSVAIPTSVKDLSISNRCGAIVLSVNVGTPRPGIRIRLRLGPHTFFMFKLIVSFGDQEIVVFGQIELYHIF